MQFLFCKIKYIPKLFDVIYYYSQTVYEDGTKMFKTAAILSLVPICLSYFVPLSIEFMGNKPHVTYDLVSSKIDQVLILFYSLRPLRSTCQL